MKKHSKLLSSNDKSDLLGYIFISPWLIGFFLFVVIPIAVSFYISFTRYDLLSAPKWIGLDNFKRMFFGDQIYWKSVRITFFFVFTAIPLRLVFALFIAILLNKRYRSIVFYRSLYYMPSLIGGSVAIAVMWRKLFGYEGAVNSIISSIIPSYEGISFVGNPKTAIWTIALLIIWEFGSPMLIFLAGLKNIPKTYYEAATVDGAGTFQKFLKITIPMLSPVIFFNLVIQIIGGFKMFTPAYIITKGGPLNSTLVYALNIYQRAFEYFDMGYASAMAWVLLIIISLLTALVFKTSSYWVFYESKI